MCVYEFNLVEREILINFKSLTLHQLQLYTRNILRLAWTILKLKVLDCIGIFGPWMFLMRIWGDQCKSKPNQSLIILKADGKPRSFPLQVLVRKVSHVSTTCGSISLTGKFPHSPFLMSCTAAYTILYNVSPNCILV